MLLASRATRSTAWREAYLNSLRLVDAVMIAVTVIVAQLLRFGFDAKEMPFDGFGLPYWIIGVVLGLVWWTWLEMRGVRDVRLVGQGIEESKELVQATLVLFGAIAIVSYAFDLQTARGYVVIALPVGIGLLLLGRGYLRRRLSQQRHTGLAMARTLVVGGRAAVHDTVRSLRTHPESGFAPVAVYMQALPRTNVKYSAADLDLPNLLSAGRHPEVDDILTACRDRRIEVLVLCASAPLSPEEIRHLSWGLADEHIRLVLDPGLTDIAGPRIHTQHMARLPLIHVSTPRMSWSRRLCKRSMDILGSLAALVLLAPLMAVLALVVKLHDGGPVLFAHERIGLDGKRFKVLKYRTMRTDAQTLHQQLVAESGGSAVFFKLKDDPRVTRPGRWMRKYSLDELPQFVNVLCGSMSLVGPRPQVQAEVDEYERHMHRRLRVKPGITGLWQVSGRSTVQGEEATRLDLYYVENWSPVQDLVILVRTVKAVVAPEGAY
ncbi:sugar transferase [Kocuria flava]|uniref:sugar transferase n=1 Tax=Kocuria flava TaxID=446860 RepID=UPI001FF66E69|nr:sugar transferase [Kocuria flava]MCJ8505903.1 sugar transferase [Kocuria flava]